MRVSLGRALFIASAVVAFLAISFAVARWLTQDNRERGAVTDLLRAQARGDVPAMLQQLEGCRSDVACRTRVESNARALRRPGAVRILRYDSATARALGDESGPTRVAWSNGPDAAIVVQCITVERRAKALLGADVVLSSIGGPIPGDAACPR